jgi:hypothetical protein
MEANEQTVTPRCIHEARRRISGRLAMTTLRQVLTIGANNRTDLLYAYLFPAFLYRGDMSNRLANSPQ